MQRQAQNKEIRQAEGPNSTMQILVVDDSETDRHQIIRLCEKSGLSFTATEASSIADMRKALSETNFDLVFLDYLLAGENGLDALDILNQQTDQKAASIMVAGEGQIGIAVEAMRRGCSDYLTKSEMSVPALQKSVATAIERRMLGLSLHQERALRLALERSIRQHANSCSSEMRTILAATLRRVRKLRSHKMKEDSALELGALEENIDRLWDALPAFSKAAETALSAPETSPDGKEVVSLPTILPKNEGLHS